MRTDKTLYLPPADEIRNMEDIKEWIRKATNLLGVNQSDVYEDIDNSVNKEDNQNISGTKTFTSLKLGGNMNCNQKQMVSMAIENRTSDPTSPATGQIWLRVDLL